MQDIQMPQQQQFTFIDVRAKKDSNQRRIKSHVSYDTNRRKRRAAVAKYQSSLLVATAQADLITTENSNSSNPLSNVSGPVQIQLQLTQRSPDSTQGTPETDRKIRDEDNDHLCKLRNERQDSWSLYVSLLRTGVSSPWQSLCKKSSPTPISVIGFHGSRVESPSPSKSSLRSPHFSLPTYIGPPAFMKETEEALLCVKHFMEAQYHRSWKHELAENPYVYEHDYELALFRECLYVAFDELRRANWQTAFTILNLCLEAAARLIKKQQPVLIFTLLDVAMDVRNFQDIRLNKMLKDYIAGLAATLLGTQHPLVTLLKYSTSREQKDYLLSTLFHSLLDVDSELFGANNFQTTGVRFAILTHKVAEGTPEALRQASTHFEIVSKQWHQSYPMDSLMCDIIDIEGIKLSHGKGTATSSEVSAVLDRALRNYEHLATISGYQTAASGKDLMHDRDLMTKLNVLGGEWLAKSYHGMALFSYTHLQDLSRHSEKSSQALLQSDEVTRDHFAAKTVRLLVHGNDE